MEKIRGQECEQKKLTLEEEQKLRDEETKNISLEDKKDSLNLDRILLNRLGVLEFSKLSGIPRNKDYNITKQKETYF